MTATDRKFKLAGNRDLARRHRPRGELKEVPAHRLQRGDQVVCPKGFTETQLLPVDSVRTYTHNHVLVKYQHPYYQTTRTRNSPVLIEVAP